MLNSRKIFITGIILSLLMISGFASPFIRSPIQSNRSTASEAPPSTKKEHTASNEPHKSEKSNFQQMNQDVLQNPPTTSTSGPEHLNAQGGTWTKAPGDWWNTDWGYRENVTLTEPGIVDRNNWPVNVPVSFTPDAYKWSIRVVSASSGKKILSQPWNLTYSDPDYLSSATVTFLANISKGTARTYQIYWSTSSKIDPPSIGEEMKLDYGTGSTYYVESLTSGYRIEGGPSSGGKVINITHLNGDEIQHEIANFGITQSPNTSYGNYWGNADTNFKPKNRGFKNEEDNVINHYRGLLATRYEIKNVSLKQEQDGGGYSTVGFVNISYTFYPTFWTVEEEIVWNSENDEVEYYTGGWVFDQDNGATEETFSYVSDTDTITNMSTKKGSNSVLNFDGTEEDYVNISHDYNYTGYGVIDQLSVSAWVKTTTTGDDQIIASFDRSQYWRLSVNGDQDSGNDRIGWYTTDEGGNMQDMNSDMTLPVGEWHYVTGTFNSTSGTKRIYINGTLHKETVGAHPAGLSLGGDALGDNPSIGPQRYGFIGVGSEADSEHPGDLGPDSYMEGSIDELTIYHHTLTQEEIQDNMHVPGSPITTGIKAYWPMNEGTGDYANDTINNYGGKLKGKPSWDTGPEITAPFNAESVDYNNNGTNWDRTAFFHNTKHRGIGVSWVSDSSAGLVVNEKKYLWHNEGNDDINDYIYWAKRFNLTNTTNGWISHKYSVIPWQPVESTPGERLTQFNNTYNATQHPLQVDRKDVEHFKLNVTVHVEDKNERPIENAEVQLKNSTSGAVLYQGTTNVNGNRTFSVNRSQYTINVSVSSVGHTYSRQITREYNSSMYDYTVYSTSETLNFAQLVHLKIYAQDNTVSPSSIQNGQVYLTNGTFTINTNTSVYGWFDALIPSGNWHLSFNGSEAEKTGWDYFNLTFYENDSYVRNSTGETTKNSTVDKDGVHNFTDINITEYQVWQLTDLNITTSAIDSEVSLYNTPSSFDTEWGTNISGMTVLQNANNGTNLNGTITWFILNPNGKCVLDYSDFGIPPENTNEGNKSFTLNTSLLPAGKSYTMKFNGTVDDTYPDPGYKKPLPITVTILVDPASTSVGSSYEPGRTVTWNENVTITLEYTTSVTPLTPGITDATVNLTVSDKVYNLTETSTRGAYATTINTSDLGGTGDYLLIFRSDRGNYTGKILEKTITVEARSTSLETASSISIPWKDNYTFTADYRDDDAGVDITTGTEVTYKIIYSGETKVSGMLSYSSTIGKYIVVVPINGTSNLTSGRTYTFRTFAEKENYESRTTRTSFELEIRSTSLTPNATSITKAYSQQVAVKFAFKDLDYKDYPFGNSLVREASEKSYRVEIVNRNITGTLTDLGDGNYIFSINSTALGVGTWTLEVNLGKTHYASQRETVSLYVEKIPTTTSASNLKPHAYYGQTVRVEIDYIDRLHDRTIPNASEKQYTFTDTGAIGSLSYNETRNQYVFEYNTSHLNTSSYTIRFDLNEPNRTKQSFTISLTVEPIPTAVFVGQKSYNVPWGDQLNVQIYYNDTLNNQFISGAITTADVNVTYTIDNETHVMDEGWNLSTNATTAWYGFSVNTVAWNIQSYRVTLVFGSNTSHYQSKVEVVTVNVKSLEISGEYSKATDPVRKNPVTGSTSAEENTFEVTLQDESHGRSLTGAIVQYKIVGETSWKKMSPGDYPGAYTTTIDWSTFKVREKNYDVKVRVSEILVDGQTVEVPNEKITMSGAISESYTVKVDYYGGSTPLFGGIIIPRVWFYAVIGIVVFIASYASIQVYSYLTTPPKVRHIREILKKVQNNVFEYPTLTREDIFNEEVQERME